MKPHYKPLATALAATLQLAALAAVPLAWDVRPGQPAPVTFDRYHGETIDFSATFRGFGELPFAPGADIRLWFQTNGMGSAWWSVPATISSNVLSATWSPVLDPGADRVSLFFGAPSNAYAAAVLRLRHSPGFAPGAMPAPIAFHESDPVFSAWLATNTLYYTKAETDERIAVELAGKRDRSDLSVDGGETVGWDLYVGSGGTPTRLVAANVAGWWSDTGDVQQDASATMHDLGDGTWMLMRPVRGTAENVGPDAGVIDFKEDGEVVARAERVRAGDRLALISEVSSVTNDTYRTLSSFAATGTVARAQTYGTPTRWTDATGCVWEVGTEWIISPSNYTGSSEWLAGEPISLVPTGFSGQWWKPVCAEVDIGITKGDEESTSLAWTSGEEAYIGITALRIFVTNLVGRVAITNDIPAAPDLSPIEQEISDLRTESALVYRLYSGSNVVAEVTNYNSQVHAPELRLMQLNESNEYVTVWTETNGLARTLATATKYTDDATNALPEVYAPRAWSRTTSGLGAEAPDGETWITTPKVYVTGGLEYHQTVDTYGAVWVLCSNGMTPEYSPDTNAYFRISADDGTPIFSIEKSDAMVVGANAAGITVGESSVTIPVPVVSPDPPTMYWRQSLSSGDWADESSPPAGATVTWTGEAGARVCTVTWSGTRPSSMFFKFTFLQEGGVVIRNNATTDISSGIYVNGVKFVPTVSGNNLIWTKQ